MPVPGEKPQYLDAEIREKAFVKTYTKDERVAQQLEDALGALRIQLRLCLQNGMQPEAIVQSLESHIHVLERLSNERSIVGLYHTLQTNLIEHAVGLVAQGVPARTVHLTYSTALAEIQRHIQSARAATPATELDTALREAGYVPTFYRTTGVVQPRPAVPQQR